MPNKNHSPSDGRVQFHWVHRHCFFSKETADCFMISFNKLVGLIDFFGSVDTFTD
jgi:hypothetical protein